MTRLVFGWPGFLAAVAGVQVWAVAGGGDYLPGDCTYYAAAAASLLGDGDLNLTNQFFPGRTTLAEVSVEVDGPLAGYFALSAAGDLTLKQSPVWSAAAVPLYALLGRPGFLVLNLLVETLLLVGLAVLAGGGPAARGVTLVGFVGSGVWRYTVNYSPDLALCGLLVGGLLAARSGRSVLAGLAAGLAVSLKLYAVAILLPVPVLAVAIAGRRVRSAALAIAGGLVGLAPGAGFNAWQFGSPLVTGYERQLRIEGGRVGVAGHTSRFVVPPAEGLTGLLTDPALGLLRTAPLWFVWPLPAVALLAGRVPAPGGRGWVAAAVAVILLNLALFSRYDGALEGSTHANRYLFPAVLTGFAVLAAAAEGWVRARDLAGRADGGC